MDRAWQVVAAALWLTMAAAGANAEPVLVGDADRPECRAALQMASAAFRATSPVLTWPVPAPDPALATVVLSRNARDISGGDGVEADAEVFDHIRLTERPFSNHVFHWQRLAQDGYRIVVVEAPMSWRGSRYSLYLAGAGFATKALPDVYLGAAWSKDRWDAFGPPILRASVYDDNWAPPTILRDTDSGRLWLLEQGEFYFWQAEWQVHLPVAEGFQSPCRVVFHDGRPGLEHLPAAVQRFARLADDTLGPGLNEGTLNPTQRNRRRVEHGWTTLAHRPLALTDTPYNSRAEVEAALAVWAKGVLARVRLHRRLLASIGPAEAALAGHLAGQFKLAEADARGFAFYAIDYMLRSHYTFNSPTGGHRHLPVVVPWPEGVR